MLKNQKSWRRVRQFKKAEELEWYRLLENPKLQTAVRKLQLDFGLPLSLGGVKPLFEDPAYIQWMGGDDEHKAVNRERAARRKRLARRAGRLLEQHHVPSHYFGSLWNLLITGNPEPSYRSGGFPTFKFERNAHGEWKPICIVTPETDLRNPLVLESIQYWQRITKPAPPQPPRIGRRRDWRPVWEWRNKNPEVSDKQIADMLGLNRVTVSRALERLDKSDAAESD